MFYFDSFISCKDSSFASQVNFSKVVEIMLTGASFHWDIGMNSNTLSGEREQESEQKDDVTSNVKGREERLTSQGQGTKSTSISDHSSRYSMRKSMWL